MNLNARRLTGIRDLLEESGRWELPVDLWHDVQRIVDRLARMLPDGDAEGASEAEHELRQLQPDRRVRPARLETTIMPEPVRERRNVLVHEIDVLLAEDEDDREA